VFLPPGAESFEVSGSWQHGLTAVVLVVWSVASLVVAVRTFRWMRADET
jgi:ABC-2 type transport system permease protein